MIPSAAGGTWNPATLGTPLLAGYGQVQPTANVRSSAIHSEPHYARISSSRTIELSVTVRQTQAQWNAWETFWSTTLVYGHKWFQIDLDNAGFTETFTVHLLEWRAAPRPDTVLSLTRLEMVLEALLDDPVKVFGMVAITESPDIVDATGTA